ncbi:cryptochrome-1 isoform X1 [Alligator mississippiensis]|uniref:cryptochrome-1 isoform X1 n=1 Tax=Alligator mississippiensis TaxID=8496 RepID=UPI0003D0B40D|nr:cryptochrome-1 isoform X1 [Alligator mississippiensis]
MGVNAVHWFRKGLRLHDNPALRECIQGADTVRCVYILDPWFAGSSNVGINRWRFLLQCLEDLDANLRKLNSRLFVIRGQPADVFPRLFKEWNITKLSIEYDSEPFGKERDAAIKKLASEAGVEVIVRISHTLYDLDKIIELNGGQPPLTYKRFQTLISRMEPLEMPVETITAEVMEKCTTPVSDDHDEKYGVPSLEELGFDTDGLPSAVWPGGETEALTRLERHLERKAWVANFERPRMNANSLLASPTGLSPYLRFGCLSCRLFYFKLTDLYKKVKKNSSPPLSLYGQLLWREFFYTAATSNPRFDKMEGNPICVQIPWDKNPEALAKWAEGRTGFPWIDAIMTQLRQEGWIHHLARHAVACFLTRGDLWISWEEGMKVFEELLLDADWSVNAGSWMWLSCSSFFQQFFHCYCPVGFGRRTDPNGDYIRRYLPVLRGFPAKYIYDPWNAPEGVQKAAKCMIGINYPKPMVNHAEASRLNIERMKQIYQQLSRYRGLGLLATVPSNPNGNGNGGLMGYSPGENVSGCSRAGAQMGSSDGHTVSVQPCALGESHGGSNGIQQQGYFQASSILHFPHGDDQQSHLLQQGRTSLSSGISAGKRPNPEEETQSIGPKVQRQSTN